MTADAMFKAIMISKDDPGQHVALTEIGKDRLPEGDVTVRVQCSTLNYKDALAITGKGPMAPGIDFAGVVEQSDHAEFNAGDAIVLNGWSVADVVPAAERLIAGEVRGRVIVPISVN